MLGLMDKIMYKGRKFIPDWTYIHQRGYSFFRVTKQYHLPDTGYDLRTGEVYFFHFYDDVRTEEPSGIRIGLSGGVFNSLLTHIKQAFRVSLLKRGALNA